MSVFAPVRPLDVRSIAGPVLEVTVPPGTHLIDERSVVGTFFVIRAGEAELWQGGRKLWRLQVGDCFGEIDPAAPAPQPYTVIAASPMRVLTFSAFGMGRLCAAMPSLRGRIVAALPARPSGAAGPATPGPATEGSATAGPATATAG
jgi:CRP-like cAMP-binding protein